MNTNEQPSNPVNVSSILPEYWTPIRLKIRSWLNEQSQSLAELYEGAVCLIFEKTIRGDVYFIAHAVREIGNGLVRHISGSNEVGKLEYKKEVNQLLKIWPSHESDTENSNSTPHNISKLPQILSGVSQLLKKHKAVSATNEEKFICFLEKCIPENISFKGTLIPIAKHWRNIIDWFMGIVHYGNSVNVKCDKQKLLQQFELFEFILGTLAENFYTTIDKLDEVLKEANPQEIDKTVAWLIHPQQRYYFFNNLNNPKWIVPLKEKGFFNNPPEVINYSIHNSVRFFQNEGSVDFPIWYESLYLVRMAKQEPEAVRDIALDIKTNNSSVHIDFVDAALQMPPEISVKLTLKVKTWIESPYFLLLLDFPEKIADFALHLANGGEVENALIIVKSLLVIMTKSSIEKYPDWTYEEFIKKYVSKLIKAVPKEMIKILSTLLCVEINGYLNLKESNNKQKKSPIPEDNSCIWLPTIKNYEDHAWDSQPREVKELLAIAVRDAAEQSVKNNPQELRSIVKELEFRGWQVFHRIALYLISKYPDVDSGLLTEKLVNQECFINLSDYEEYIFLINKYFGRLPEEKQKEILNWIEKPHIDLSECKDQEERTKCEKQWQQKKLAVIKDSLSPEWQQRYNQLINDCGTTVNFSNTTSREVATTRSIESPETIGELASMSIEELVSFLKIWRPASKDPSEPGPSIARLERTLSKLVEQSPERFTLAAEHFQGLHSRYRYALLLGLHNALKALKSNKELEGIQKEFAWPSVLKLCHWFVEEFIENGEWLTTDSDYELNREGTQWAVLNLLKVGFSMDNDTQIPFNLRSEVWDILKPFSSNINLIKLPSFKTLRDKAIHTVVGYAFWVQGHFNQSAHASAALTRGFEEMPEVRQVLDTHLNLSPDPSLAICPIYGHMFQWLILLDRNWVTQNVAKIFPRDETLSHLRITAWERYIIATPVDKSFFNELDIFEVLHEEYSYAIERINATESERRTQKNPNYCLVEHLVHLYWHTKLSLEQPNSLLLRFFELAPDKLRSDFLKIIGLKLCKLNSEIEPQLLNKLQLLWKHRLDTARAASLPASYGYELAAFSHWLISRKFDDSWAITQLKEVLEVCNKVEYFTKAVEYLAVLADTMPELTIECLRLIIKGVEEDIIFYLIIKYRQEVNTILVSAIERGNHIAKETAIKLINRLGELGQWEFRHLLSDQSK